MQWTDVTKPPTPKILRQFSGLCLVLFLGLALWRAVRGEADLVAAGLAAAGLVIGAAGFFSPRTIRYLYTGWMIAAFPIGWAVSRLVLGLVYFVLITPMAIVFRLVGRDILRRRRDASIRSYWVAKRVPEDVREYFRQF